MEENNIINNMIKVQQSIDTFSVEGKYIKEYMTELKTFPSKYSLATRKNVSAINPNYPMDKIITRENVEEFVNKYCTGPKAIKDDIYYFINAKRNNYEFLTLQRDLDKSPRKEFKQKIVAKPYKATYDNIEKDPEMIANYYSKKYSISDKENIVAIMTEDDVLCLNCGCISDQRLSDVPDLKTHINNMVCPKCGSTTSTLVTFNKYLHKTSMHCRDAQK